jgi:hypothetical protein
MDRVGLESCKAETGGETSRSAAAVGGKRFHFIGAGGAAEQRHTTIYGNYSSSKLKG